VKKRLGVHYSLTGKEVKKVKSLLMKQYRLRDVWKLHFEKDGCTYREFKTVCDNNGIDANDLNKAGLATLRVKAYEMLGDFEDDKDKFNAILKYLERYEKIDDISSGSDTATVNIDIAVNKVMEDLNQ